MFSLQQLYLRHDSILYTLLEQYDEFVNLIKINHGATILENSATTRTTWLWSWLIN